MRYRESDLVSIARRENNTKRNYLVVNRKQGKHIPVRPKEALALFRALAELLKAPYRDERLLVVGFAETATAIGACVAAQLHAYFIQTTRENIPGAEYLYFSESHSHAVEQRLVREDIEAVAGQVDRVIFVEDEVTTGNTILSAVRSMEQVWGQQVKFSVASLLNGMDSEAIARYRERGISLHYLVKTDHSAYGSRAEKYTGRGIYQKLQLQDCPDPLRVLAPSGCLDSRRLQNPGQYERACREMAGQVLPVLCGAGMAAGRRCLVLGTEECMFPGLYLAEQMEESGCRVRFHATTRSPIAVSPEAEYPLHVRYELCSMYEAARRTFVYDLAAYEEAVIVCDAQEVAEQGIISLQNALVKAGNRHITLVRWQR